MTPERIDLKRATADMLKGVGGLEAAAGFTRVGKSSLGDYGSLNRGDCFAPIDVIADLEPLARDREGWPHVTRALCRQMGGTFVALPEARASAGDALAMLSGCSGKMHATTTEVCAAVADQRIDGAEARRIEACLHELISDAAAMIAAMRTIGEGR